MSECTATLPAELIDYTIDFLHDDSQSLKACALTCKAWLASSRFHLFGTVTLATEKDLGIFVTFGSNAGSSQVLPYIRTLSISKTSIFEACLFLASGAHSVEHTPWETTVPQRFPSNKLPSLRTLHLKGFQSFWQPNSFSLSSFAKVFPTISCVKLENCSVSSLDDLAKLLGELKDVESLCLDGVSFGRSSATLAMLTRSWEASTASMFEDHTMLIATPPRSPSPVLNSIHSAYFPSVNISLKRLRIDNSSKPITDILYWLASTSSVDSLKSLAFTRVSTKGTYLDDVNEFLRSLGDGLEELTLGVEEESELNLSGESFCPNCLCVSDDTYEIHFNQNFRFR
ncbi:hypothetical protein C8Q75DRAFT_781165 [Abortiporus biennis]|nr:hypothetical protein C8Q75DRAFT_781165 [Abortiporus biennis]